jgi:all-trans-retinol 13,14-reductase
MKRWDVIVVGSGISSLTAATLLAKKGRSVCVLERHTKPGGYLHCFKRFGTRFDTGAHYVGAMGPGEPFRTLLEYLGVYDPEFFIKLDPEGFDEIHFPTFKAVIGEGYERNIDHLSSLFPADREGIRRFFYAMKAAAELFPTYQYRDEFDEAELKQVLETSLMTVTDREVKDPRLKCVLFAYCCLHGVQPEDISFGFHALVTDSLLRGAYGFRQGGDALANRFVKVLESYGGKVITKCGVKELKVAAGEVTGVVTDYGETLTGEWIISGIHPKATFRLIADAKAHFRPAFLQRIDHLPESPGLMGVYAKSKNASAFKANRNYLFFRDEDPRTFLKVKDTDSVPCGAFVARPERTDTVEGGTSLLFHSPGPMSWFRPWEGSKYGQRSTDYLSFKESKARSLFAFVDRFSPGLESSIEQFSVSTPVTNLHFNGSEEGSPYGIYHSIQYSGVRALQARTHLKNLLLTGQSILFPGLMGASISGLRTAGSIIGIKELLRELKHW